MPATYEPIATTTLGSTVSSYTFSSIPQTYSDLRLVATVQRGTAGSGWYVTLNCNGNTGANYGYQIMTAYGGTIAFQGFSSVNDTAIYCNINDPGGASQWALVVADIINYTSTTVHKGMLISHGNAVNGTYGQTSRTGGNFFSSSAITSLTLNGANYNLASGSQLTLFGIKKA